MHKATILSLSQ